MIYIYNNVTKIKIKKYYIYKCIKMKQKIKILNVTFAETI